MSKVPIALQHPDKILLVYGDKQIELKLTQDFSNYIVSVDESELESLKPYMVKGEGGIIK